MPFKFTNLELKDVILVRPSVFPDERGEFVETYKRSDFVRAGITEDFNQDNHSFSVKDVLRGLHYQVHPEAQGKLVRVITGAVWDVAVDIRKGSPTFLKWVAHELSDENKLMLYIPSGFAHGFVCLSDKVNLTYKCTSEYSPSHERGIRWDDSAIDVDWPISNPLVSEKDSILPCLDDAEVFEYEFSS